MSTRNLANQQQPKDSFGRLRTDSQSQEDTVKSRVRLSNRETTVEAVLHHSPLATEDHVVEIARDRLDINHDPYFIGEVVR